MTRQKQLSEVILDGYEFNIRRAFLLKQSRYLLNKTECIDKIIDKEKT